MLSTLDTICHDNSAKWLFAERLELREVLCLAQILTAKHQGTGSQACICLSWKSLLLPVDEWTLSQLLGNVLCLQLHPVPRKRSYHMMSLDSSLVS